MKQPADIVFVNGSVVTVDGKDRVCEAAAVSDRRIDRVGTTAEVTECIGPETTVIDLKGRSLVPGFVDAHCHAGIFGTEKLRIQCYPSVMASIAEMGERIRERARTTPPDRWIVGRGYDQTQLAERRHPTRRDLDVAAPGHAVAIFRTCGHVGVVNSRGLELLGITRDTPDPDGGRIERDDAGEPTGVLFESARIPVWAHTQPTRADLQEAVGSMVPRFLSLGITSVQDATGRNPDEIRAFHSGLDRSPARLRLYFMVRVDPSGELLGENYLKSGLKTGFGNERVRLGAAKLMADGGIGGRTAAMREPFPGDPENRGILYMDPEAMDATILRCHAAGYQIAIHAIGDRAIELSLQGFEKALKRFPRPDHRHRIEHCSLLDDRLMDRMRDLGIIAAVGVPFLYESGEGYAQILDSDRLHRLYPLASLIRRGIVSPLNSDAPVIDPNPMHGIFSAVTRRSKSGLSIAPGEAVSIGEAIRAYTIYGAYASFEETIKGSIETGKLADLVVLSEDILAADPERIPEIRADLTLVDGRIVFDRTGEAGSADLVNPGRSNRTNAVSPASTPPPP